MDGRIPSLPPSLFWIRNRARIGSTKQANWAVEVVFDSAELLDTWLDSPERQTVLSEGEAQGCWRCASDLILGPDELPPANTGVFLHSVAPRKEAELVAAQSDLTRIGSAFPGYEGTAVFPADSTGQWMLLLRFRTPHHLTGWIRSRER